MQIGLVGLPHAGKNTLFATLLQHKSAQSSFKARLETERGVVKVPDKRLEQLAALFNPKSEVPSTVEYLKVPGLESTDHKVKELPAQFLANVRTVDAILLLVRAFQSDLYPHPFGRVDPRADIAFANSEFVLSDLSLVETKIERIEKQKNKKNVDGLQKELDLLVRCKAWMEEGRPFREFDATPEEEKMVRGFQFLTAKPILYVINIEESDIPSAEALLESYSDLKSQNASVTCLCASIEKEISELEPEDQQEFLTQLGIREPALYRVIHQSYELLGLISFFTVGEDECRAWTLRRGSNAQTAAGVIHADLEKGFIRADVVPCKDLIAQGSLSACKSRGLSRLEGRDYVVQDGDVIEIRFSG